jgi:hydrogenase maturation protease
VSVAGRTVVAGVGNVFLGDDGFGVAVAQRLARQTLPAEVRVLDVGIRGVHLAYELLDGFETMVLVDTASRGDPPGTVSLVEPDLAPVDGSIDGHGFDPTTLLGMLDRLGAPIGRVLVVTCEPETVEEGIGLSPPVEAAVDEAVSLVLDVVRARVAEEEVTT